MTPTKEAIDLLTKKLIDKGLLIEAGWQGLKIIAIPADAPPVQLEEMRNAFFAGAHHVFTTMLNVLDEDASPTVADLTRMSNIHNELELFIIGFKTKHHLT